MSYRFVGPHQALPAPLPGYMIGLGFPAPDQVIYSSAKLENINCIVEPTMESGGLYLGDIISTKKEELLKKHNIRAVLSCGVEAGNSFANLSVQPKRHPKPYCREQ